MSSKAELPLQGHEGLCGGNGAFKDPRASIKTFQKHTQDLCCFKKRADTSVHSSRRGESREMNSADMKSFGSLAGAYEQEHPYLVRLKQRYFFLENQVAAGQKHAKTRETNTLC